MILASNQEESLRHAQLFNEDLDDALAKMARMAAKGAELNRKLDLFFKGLRIGELLCRCWSTIFTPRLSSEDLINQAHARAAAQNVSLLNVSLLFIFMKILVPLRIQMY